MRSRKNKLISTLACAAALAGMLALSSNPNVSSQNVVEATSSVASRSYGVDVSSYQGTDLSRPAAAGAQFAIVKVSEGTGYRNPAAVGQIASAQTHNLLPMAYHFATFGSDSDSAQAEAAYAVSSAKAAGLPAGSYLVVDWEAGDGNQINGDISANTAAISTFMTAVRNAGYQPMLYSGANLLRSKVSTSTILASFPNSLWVASYAAVGRIDTPNFGYFPAMNGVAIWQFTDNWKGLRVDGNISLLPLSFNQESVPEPAAGDQMGLAVPGGSPVATVAYQGNIALWQTPNGTVTGRYLPQGSKWAVSGKAQVNGKWWYNLGGNQWVLGDYVYVTGLNSIPVISAAPKPAASLANKQLPNGQEQGSASVATINYIPGYGVNIWSINGGAVSFTGSREATGEAVTTYDSTVLGGVSYTRINSALSNQWIQTQYLKGGSNNGFAKIAETPISGTVRVHYLPGYGVRLLNAGGQYQDQYVQHGATFKVWAKKIINGKMCYRIGSQAQWIPAQYAVLF